VRVSKDVKMLAALTRRIPFYSCHPEERTKCASRRSVATSGVDKGFSILRRRCDFVGCKPAPGEEVRSARLYPLIFFRLLNCFSGS